MSASFHRSEDGFEHQNEMPDARPPEELTPELELMRRQAERIPASVREVLTQDRPFDFRLVDSDPFDDTVRPGVRQMWLRAVGTMPDDALSHQAALAYASDYGLLAAAVQPHGLGIRSPQLQAATLDHAIWFHRPFRADEWLLYSMDSPAAAGSR